MPRINDLFPSKYLAAKDLMPLKHTGKLPVRVTVSHVIQEKVGLDEDGGKLKPVVYFMGKDKGLVLNRVNAEMLMEIAGTDDTDQWTHLVVGLDIQKDKFKGVPVDCLRFTRLRGQAPAAPRQAVAAVASTQATRGQRQAAPAPPDDDWSGGGDTFTDRDANDDDIPF